MFRQRLRINLPAFEDRRRQWRPSASSRRLENDVEQDAIFASAVMKSSSTKRAPDQKYRERVYKIVRRIPRGRVMTYGQIAYMLGEGYTPRTVGFVMHGANERDTPMAPGD